MSDPIISVSGLRGILGISLTPELAARYACAFAALAPRGSIVLTRDGRASGRMLCDAIRAALQAVGRTVLDADVAATPTTGVLVRHLGAAGGIQVSASHNPSEYNGLKLFSAEGRVISAEAGQQVIDRYRHATPEWVESPQLGRVSTVVAAADAHLQLILPTVNVNRIRARQFKVVLDANHGSGSLLGVALLEALGCNVIVLGGYPDGAFEHPPEPTAENLASVLSLIPAESADVGFCQDPDADRLAVIDERGEYIGEEYTLALCADHVLRHQSGAVVTNCSTSRMTEDIAERHGVPFERSAVGEANVTAVMESLEAVLGGEGNGGVIDPRVGLVRDSFISMALILDALAERETTVSRWVAELPRYEIHKTKVRLAPERLAAALDALRSHFKSAQFSTLDGLRLDWEGKWLLVRASNTEPIVRIIAEARTIADAQTLCDQAADVLGRVN